MKISTNNYITSKFREYFTVIKQDAGYETFEFFDGSLEPIPFPKKTNPAGVILVFIVNCFIILFPNTKDVGWNCSFLETTSSYTYLEIDLFLYFSIS